MKLQNKVITLKISEEEKDLIKNVSDKIGLSYTSFIRSSAIERAKILLNKLQEGNNGI